MKCGICGKDTHPSGLPIYNLAAHKRQAHPAEMRQAASDRQTKANATRHATAARKVRIQAAGETATGIVLEKWRDVRLPSQVQVLRYYHLSNRIRTAHAPSWERYETLLAQANEALVQAYDLGTPITEVDVERVRLAMAKAESEAQP